MRVRPLTDVDLEEWLRLRAALWPDVDRANLRAEQAEYLGARSDRAAFVAERPDGRLCGLIELSLRNVVDSCASSPVGYIEGWFVDSDVRRQGIGRALVRAGEAWARGRGCTEMGSDAELENEVSQKAHAALGYEATGRVVNFRRALQ